MAIRSRVIIVSNQNGNLQSNIHILLLFSQFAISSIQPSPSGYLYTFGSHENFYRDLKKYLQ